MTQPIPVATSSSIPIPAGFSSTPPQSPHPKGSPRTSLMGVQSDPSRNASPTIRGILKSNSSSPRSEPSSPSPKSVLSSKDSSPRVVLFSHPEVDHLREVSDEKRLQCLRHIYTIFDRTKAVLKNLADQLLEKVEPEQQLLAKTYKTILKQDADLLQKSYVLLEQARAQFFEVFDPWYIKIKDQATRKIISEEEKKKKLAELESVIANLFRHQLKNESLPEGISKEWEEIFLTPKCAEFITHLKSFRRSLNQLSSKFDTEFVDRLKPFRFLISDEHFEEVSMWISHQVFREIYEYHTEYLDSQSEIEGDKLKWKIEYQTDRNLFKNVIGCIGKKRVFNSTFFLLDYNLIMVRFFIRNTQFLSPHSDSVMRIQVNLLWRLSQLVRFVHRLDKYLEDSALEGDSPSERIQSLLKKKAKKCFKIFAMAVEFREKCGDLAEWLKIIAERSGSSSYSEIQSIVQTQLIHYLDKQGVLAKAIEAGALASSN